MYPKLFVLGFAVLSSFIAHADTFQITGNGQNISFSLPSSPTPTSYQTGNGFLFHNMSVDINGVTVTTDVAFANTNGYPIDLFIGNNESVSLFGQIYTGDPSYGVFDGPQLYIGSEAQPTFLTGPAFTITNIENPSNGGTPGGAYNLSITGDSSVTPEPSSFVLLGTGLIGVAGALRKRIS